MAAIAGPEQVLSRLVGIMAHHDTVQLLQLSLLHAMRQAQIRQRAVLTGDLQLFQVELLGFLWHPLLPQAIDNGLLHGHFLALAILYCIPCRCSHHCGP
jgi:hypothetical protein